ncbi:hypothetical protein P7K49_037495 [Saguinus oedipus]|uniref:Uncharacterized protein n=1 Tax=Saguinus oedipus TaxID=9490 RepID=A0ABQ9TI86_SAGOE|nr:hypothetical protein P7K49_037495 [Saguinus oedipus]
MPAASVPMRESAAPKLEPVPAPLGGMGPTASCPARRGNLEQVVPVTVTVTTLIAVTRFMDAVSVRLAGWPVSLAATANAVCPASAGITPPATPRTGRATAWLAGQALTAPSHALQDTGEKTVPSSASVTMVGPAIPRMGAVSAPQAGLDPTACKVPTEGELRAPAPT